MGSIVTFAVEKGPRSYQEDRHLHIKVVGESGPHGKLLAVMDGHGGKEVSEFCEKEIKNVFQLSRPEQAEAALKDLVAWLSLRTAHFHEGSTISLALITDVPRKVSIAVLGDSPVVVYDKQGKLHTSPEHNVRSNIEERKGAEERGGIYGGGYIWNDLGDLGQGLQMGRALGDARLGNILSREPDVYTIAEPLWVLVASDGLFDPGHSNTDALVEEIRKYAERNANADELMKWAERRGLQDNATALVWYPG